VAKKTTWGNTLPEARGDKKGRIISDIHPNREFVSYPDAGKAADGSQQQ
jgi:hypothetical protein